MRRVLFLPILLTCLTSVAAAQRQIDRGARLARDGAVRIHNLTGVVRLHGWDRDSIAAAVRRVL